jgi:aspartate/methionine/tyrosine aminotransferase
MKGACGPHTRAVLVVSPNNPTGSMLRADDRDFLVEYAEAGGYAIISDEVFAGYPIVPRPDAVSMLGESRVLTFTLGGLSKYAGLPQLKLGWMVVSGPDDIVADAMDRLELICDTYLSVSTPVQVAASQLIASGKGVRDAIRQRVQQNYRELVHLAQASPSVRVIEPEGGWSVVIEVPETVGEEALVRRILDEEHVVVHPGYFFDIQQGAHIVVSLLPEPDVFADAITRVLDQVAAS